MDRDISLPRPVRAPSTTINLLRVPPCPPSPLSVETELFGVRQAVKLNPKVAQEVEASVTALIYLIGNRDPCFPPCATGSLQRGDIADSNLGYRASEVPQGGFRCKPQQSD